MTPASYVVRCDCGDTWRGSPHYFHGYDGTERAWVPSQSGAKRLSLAEARYLASDGPGRVVRLVKKAAMGGGEKKR